LLKFKLCISLFLLFCLAPVELCAQTIPAFDNYIVDKAALLKPEIKAKLLEALKSFHLSQGPQIVLLTVPALEGYPIEDYSIRVSEEWKIGDRDKDDGVLLLVAAKDRKLRIEVGAGVEGDLTDLESSRIIRDYIVPQFKKQNYQAGIVYGLEAIANKLGAPLLGQKLPARPKGRTSFDWILLLIFIFFWLLPLIVAKRKRKQGLYYGGSHWDNDSFRGGSMGRGGGFSSGGGGFSGGGGGSFSGGGASGGW